MSSQLIRMEQKLDKIVAAMEKQLGTSPAGTEPATQGAPPASVIEFIDRIMVPAAGADPAAVKARDEALQRWEQQFDEAHFEGKFGVWNLTEADKVYVDSVQEAYFRKTGKDIMRDGLFNGKNVHLNAVRRDGNALRGTIDMSGYDSLLKKEVERRLA